MFEKTYRLPVESSTSSADSILEGINIVFWTISKGEVPTNINVEDSFFKKHKLTLLENEYSERGNYNLSLLPHEQTQLVYNLEIGYHDKFLTLLSANARLQSALIIAKLANEHFDRSEEVDEAVLANFANAVIPSADALTPAEASIINRCKDLLKWGDEQQKWTRIPGTLNDVVEKYESATVADKMLTV